MNNLLRHFYILIVILTSNIVTLTAQIPASLDQNFILNTSLSDEFSSSPINTSRWTVFNKINYPWGGDYCFDDDQVTITNGALNLEVKKKLSYDNDCYWDHNPNGPALYYSGGIQSINEDYSYGYFEIEAKFPGSYINGTPNGRGFWPAFWTYHVEGPTSCRTIHDEIDIMDPGGLGYQNANTMVSHWNDENTNCGFDEHGGGEFVNSQPLFSNYHKYGVEWLSDRIIYYFDGQPFGMTYNDPKIVMDPQRVVIDLQMDYLTAVDPLAQFPSKMEVKYFRYYTLNCQYCNSDATIINSTQLNSFAYGVRSNITIGTGNSNISLSSNSNITFRASNSITINGEFTAPVGCTLNIINTPCL